MSSRVTRRQALKGLGAAGIATLAAACAGPTPTPVVQIVEQTKVVEKKETVQVEKLVEKPVIVTATPAPTPAGGDLAASQTARYICRDMDRMDPAAQGGFGRFMVDNMFMSMFLRDNKQNLQPWLATKIDGSADMKQWTVNIDPRAVWSDGSPVKAQEAKDYWTWGVNKNTPGSWLAGEFDAENIVGGKDIIEGNTKDWAGIVVKDDKTLVFNLTNPNPVFAHRMAMYDSGFCKMEDVQDQSIKQKVGDTETMVFWPNEKTRVNGPYIIKTFNIDQKKFEVMPNPKWWGDKKPKLTSIVQEPLADENVMYIMWQNNEMDVTFFLSNIREQVRKANPEAFVLIPYPTNLMYVLRIDRAPTDDLNVRKALIHAVDWPKAIAAAWENTRNDRFMSTLLTPELPCYKKGNWPEWGFDPAKAKQEIAASKYGSVDKLGKIRISTGGTTPGHVRTAEVMLEQWKTNLGLTDAELKPGWQDAWGQDQNKINFQRVSQGATLPDSASFLKSHYDWLASDGLMKLKDDQVAAGLAQMAGMKRDDPTYCPTVQKTEAQLLSNYIYAPMIWDIYEFTVKPWVKNFGTNIDNGWARVLDMYIAKH